MAERQERNPRGEEQEAEEREQAPVRGSEAYVAELFEIQKVDFALVELTLYLDTHPGDIQAVQQFNQLAQKRRQLVYPFEMKYGPMLQFGLSYTRYPWQWNDAPWPWQV
nr:spore coat protein CotJB [Cohnella sp. REN36]